MNTYAASVSLLWTTAFRAVGIASGVPGKLPIRAGAPGGIFAPDQPHRKPLSARPSKDGPSADGPIHAGPPGAAH